MNYITRNNFLNDCRKITAEGGNQAECVSAFVKLHGISEWSVRRWLRASGLLIPRPRRSRRRHVSAATKRLILAAVANKESIPSIAIGYGVSESFTYQLIRDREAAMKLLRESQAAIAENMKKRAEVQLTMAVPNVPAVPAVRMISVKKKTLRGALVKTMMKLFGVRKGEL